MSSEEYTVQLIRETDMAFLVSDGDTECWLPKSKCEEIRRSAPDKVLTVDTCTEPVMITIDVPDWLAQDKGLI